MKRIVIVLAAFVLFSASALSAEESEGVSLGVRFLAGGRYDNVRMCVGSPAGVPGGPIGEVYVDIRLPVNESADVVFNLPLFRPIVFGAAFGMLQLEPVVMYEQTLRSSSGAVPVVGGGLGVVLHYGPDYNSSLDDPGEPFFSIGPLINGFAGLALKDSKFTIGVKGFFSPLVTAGEPIGNVAGGGLGNDYSLD